MAALTSVYASDSMLGGYFVFKLGTKYPLKAKYLDVLLYSFPNTYGSTGRTLWPSWRAAKYNLWLVLNWFVDFMKGPVKKNSLLSPKDDNSYIFSISAEKLLDNSEPILRNLFKMSEHWIFWKEIELKLLFHSLFQFSSFFVHFIFHWLEYSLGSMKIVSLIPVN